MDEVRTVAEQADSASSRVMASAAEVGQTADMLRVEVTDFLDAMSRHDGDRRAYERRPGHGTRATVTIQDDPPFLAEVRDICRGSVSLRCEPAAPAGTTVRIELPDSGPVSGRVVRREADHLVVAFQQSAQNLAVLDKALMALENQAVRPAA